MKIESQIKEEFGDMVQLYRSVCDCGWKGVWLLNYFKCKQRCPRCILRKKAQKHGLRLTEKDLHETDYPTVTNPDQR